MRMHIARSLWAVQARSSRRILLFQNSNEPRGGGGGERGCSAINLGKLIVRHKLRCKRLPPAYLNNILD